MIPQGEPGYPGDSSFFIKYDLPERLGQHGVTLVTPGHLLKYDPPFHRSLLPERLGL